MVKENKKRNVILTISLIFVVSGGAFFIGWLIGNDWQFSEKPKQFTPTIDGIIGKREWIRSSYFIPFYLDVDNSIDITEGKANVDGWNYMYVAEDETYYYVALDLCSDRTNNEEGEWIGFHLANRLPDASGTSLAFYSLEDYGYEYFFYNVSSEKVFDYFYDVGIGGTTYSDIPLFPETDSISVSRGDTNGNFYDFWIGNDNRNYTGTSNFYSVDGSWLSGDYLDLHFAVNISEKLPDEEISSFLSSITDLKLRYRLSSNLTSNPSGHYGIADEFYCSVYEHGGMPSDINDPSFDSNSNNIVFSANSIVTGGVDLDHNTINTTNGMFYFTIHCYNEENATDPTAYDLKIDKLSLRITSTQLIYAIVGNTIALGNYDIAYSYGPSENCGEDHRIFEFKMAKSEFPVLEDDMLYINVCGYGTMALVGSNYWLYPMYGYPGVPLYSALDEVNDFLPLDMSIT
ncbi:MAG: hypothetical protein JW776_01450 [Candidatus Lokiarchaeota archaeon]|nr:hypothetical protein [Candidatus Lokiarchaeota archaeon]